MKLVRRSLYTCVLFASVIASAVHVVGPSNARCFVRVDPPEGQSFILPLNVGETSTDTLALVEAEKICMQFKTTDKDGNTFSCDKVECRRINL